MFILHNICVVTKVSDDTSVQFRPPPIDGIDPFRAKLRSKARLKSFP